MNAVLEAKEINSMADVEIGQIVYSSWGYDQTNIDFYKVIRKTAAMVELRAIGQKYLESTSSMSEYVVADADNELFESAHMSRAEAIKKNAEIVSEMDGGNYVYAKYAAISKHKAQFSNGRLAVKFASYKYGWSWDGQRLHQSHWA
jgi:hypothetical protein